MMNTEFLGRVYWPDLPRWRINATNADTMTLVSAGVTGLGTECPNLYVISKSVGSGLS